MSGQTKTAIQTERLLLRWFTMDDLDELAAILAMPEVMRFSLNGPYSREQTEKSITKWMAGYESKGYGLLAVIHRADRKFIGYCGLIDQVIDGVDEVEIGYRLHPDYWGLGLATEAAKAVRDHGFNGFRFKRLISIIEAENRASVKVAWKNGMQWEKEALFHGKVTAQIYAVAKDRGCCQAPE